MTSINLWFFYGLFAFLASCVIQTLYDIRRYFREVPSSPVKPTRASDDEWP